MSALAPPLRNPSELPRRLGLSDAGRLLLVDAPQELSARIAASRRPGTETFEVESEALRSAKGLFDAVLVWRESRVGSQAVLEGAARRLIPGGAVWVVTAMRKVQGPRTAAAHRLDLDDLRKAFARHGLAPDGEVRLTAWHVGYRFAPGGGVRAPSESGASHST